MSRIRPPAGICVAQRSTHAEGRSVESCGIAPPPVTPCSFGCSATRRCYRAIDRSPKDGRLQRETQVSLCSYTARNFRVILDDSEVLELPRIARIEILRKRVVAPLERRPVTVHA